MSCTNIEDNSLYIPQHICSPGWQAFVDSGNALSGCYDSHLERLSAYKWNLFSPEELMKFDVIDLFDSNETRTTRIVKTTLGSDKDVESYFSRSEVPKSRYISIYAGNSLKPLRITEASLWLVLTANSVGPEFLDLLLFFATANGDPEAGLGAFSRKERDEKDYELQCCYNYVEAAGPDEKSWAVRQTGIYQRHNLNEDQKPSNLCILLHPGLKPLAQIHLESTLQSWKNEPLNLRTDCILAHRILMSTHFARWRWYLKDLNGTVERQAAFVLAMDYKSDSDYTRGFEILHDLHELEDQVSSISPRLHSILKTVRSLEVYGNIVCVGSSWTLQQSMMIHGELGYYDIQIQGYLANVEMLERRVQEILKLLGVALNFKSQSTAVRINRNMWYLTKDSVDDNAAVKVITIVTLVYLPASFVATFLGMNLFSFQTSEDSGFIVSKKFWIFIAIAVPLTIVTVGSWLITVHRSRCKRATEQELLLGGKDVHETNDAV